MKKIAILGSTGSIGTQTLDVISKKEDLEVVGISAGSNIEMLEAQIRRFPEHMRTRKLQSIPVTALRAVQRLRRKNLSSRP